ncbi:hypothetical protein NDK43_31445 [Neobacillus pocheonensis]|uniref:Uncharacterized protein n=1 Tax=Neobacillus pocheonensis TaxID=363869 RepID=A0ABT0WI39_9BACI|nr:hypothetical protein [Neobacillus pocheonensis]
MSSKHLLVAAVAWICFVLLSLPQSIYGASSRQGHHKVTIQNVIVVEEDKIKLVGEGDFKGKTIRLVSQTGETLLAAYNPAEKMFITPTGKRAVPGVGYDVKADWAQIPKKQAHFVIPNLLFAKQVTSNRIELLYDLLLT